MTLPIIEFNVPAEDVRDVRRALSVRASSVDTKRIFRDVVLEWVLEFVERQFDTEGAHGATGRWEDYSGEPKYRGYKAAIVGHLDLLRWEKGGQYEQLYPSLTETSHPQNVTEITETQFSFGTKVPHASDVARHTEGPFGEPSPAREILAIGSDQQTELFRDISRDIRDHEGLPRGGPGATL